MHTERQLVIVAIEDAGQAIPLLIPVVPQEGFQLGTLIIPAAPNADLIQNFHEVQGTLQIYTGASPCWNQVDDNLIYF